MKKFLLLAATVFFATALYAQTDSIQPPYKKFPTFPPVKLLTADSTSKLIKNDLPKKRPVMLMVFSPDCDHCKHETEELVKNIDKFEKITIVMATMYSYKDMIAFREKYGLAQYSNIIMGKDTDFFLMSFYSIHNMPFLAFYNKKGNFVSVFEGNLPMEKVLAELEK